MKSAVYNVKRKGITMSARQIHALLAIVVLIALAVNSASHNTGWVLVGEIFGWSLIIGGLWLVIDKCIKERVE